MNRVILGGRGLGSVLPYDNTLALNRMISNKDPNNIIYSVDMVKVLKSLGDDDLTDLLHVSLAGRIHHQNPGNVTMWDVLFNMQGLTGCVLLTDSEYKPIDPNRVLTATPYLDFGMKVSRIHLNKVKMGDNIIVGVYDREKNDAYILIYRTKDTCNVAKYDTVIVDRVDIIPTVNCDLIHVVRMKNDCDVETATMTDDTFDNEKIVPVIESVFDTLLDIENGYPWKPHFQRYSPDRYNKTQIESDLNQILQNVDIGSYDDFEDYCRRAYNLAKVKYKNTPRVSSPPITRSITGRTKRAPKTPIVLPIVEVYSIGEYIIGCVDIEAKGVFSTVKFHRDTIGNKGPSEPYLLGNDLIMRKIIDDTSVMLLDVSYGKYSTFRYFTLNF